MTTYETRLQQLAEKMARKIWGEHCIEPDVIKEYYDFASIALEEMAKVAGDAYTTGWFDADHGTRNLDYISSLGLKKHL